MSWVLACAFLAASPTNLTVAVGPSLRESADLTSHDPGVTATAEVTTPLERAAVGLQLGFQVQGPRPAAEGANDYGTIFLLRIGPAIVVHLIDRLTVDFAFLYEHQLFQESDVDASPEFQFTRLDSVPGLAATVAGAWRFQLTERWWLGPRLEIIVGATSGYGAALQLAFGMDEPMMPP